MIQNNQELEATLARIRHFQKQIEKLREVETNPQNYRLSVGGFLAEIDRMNLEVREYLSIHPSELIEDRTGCRNRYVKSRTKATELEPDHAEAYYNRGTAYSKKGEVELAIEDYTKALELKSDYADAYYNRSGAFLRLGEREKPKQT